MTHRQPSIVIYTANFGSKDVLHPPVNTADLQHTPADLIYVTDNPQLTDSLYQVVHQPASFSDVTKNARNIKINGFPGIDAYDVAIWHDSSTQFDCSQIKELSSFAAKYALSTFRHGREDVYLEAIACIEMGKDRPIRMAKQMRKYHRAGLPAHYGLFETTMMVFNVKQYIGSELNRTWWNEVLHGSRRDQLSLPYAQFISGTEIGVLEGSGHSNPYYNYLGHRYEHYIDPDKPLFSDSALIRKLAIRYIYKLRYNS